MMLSSVLSGKHTFMLVKAVLSVILLTADVAYGRLMFRYGAKRGDMEFRHDCDDCFEAVDLSCRYWFFNFGYDRLYVGSNGYITFDSGYTWYAPAYISPFNGPKMVAALWSDVFLPGLPNDSHVWYRETTEKRDLDKAQKIINRNFDSCGSYFKPRALFIVTWDNVMAYCERYCRDHEWTNQYCYDVVTIYNKAYQDNDISKSYGNDTKPPTSFGENKPKPSESAVPKSHKKEVETKYFMYWARHNTFQLVLATDGYNTFAIMNYKGIRWESCFNVNKMLFNGGDGYHFYLNPTYPLIKFVTTSNIHKAGRWAYKISSYRIQAPNCTSIGT